MEDPSRGYDIVLLIALLGDPHRPRHLELVRPDRHRGCDPAGGRHLTAHQGNRRDVRGGSDRHQTQGLLQELQRQLDGLAGKWGPSDLPVGLGLDEGDGQRLDRGTSGKQWVEPTTPRSKPGTAARRRAFPRASGRPRKACRPQWNPSPKSAAAHWAHPRRLSTPCHRTRRSWGRLP